MQVISTLMRILQAKSASFAKLEDRLIITNLKRVMGVNREAGPDLVQRETSEKSLNY